MRINRANRINKTNRVSVNIDKILIKRGKNKQWLADQTGASYSTIVNLVNNKTYSISFDLLREVCYHLDCSPNDIFNLSIDNSK